ncbi:MAG: amidohydrolase family protein [Actinomycetota bacterium]|nr:amidohydrolase family protein [Actinomycetota bacterium]
MYADALASPWFAALLEDLPPVELFDAHTHIGLDDPDGFRCTAEELTDALALAGSRAVVFPMQEPAGYPAANDRVLAAAAASEGRLVAFCRLDPARGAVREAERCLAAGARGLKLHPRAEAFSLADRPVADIFAVAHERRLPVIIHAGRGIPALGRHILGLSARFPDARPILAHAGVSDLAWIWRHLDDHPGVFFDTAWWHPVDLLALFALVPPGRILFASDTPYGTPVSSAVLSLRCAVQAGLTAEQLEAVAGGQLRRLLAGDPPLDLGPAPGPAGVAPDVLLERVYSLLVSGIARAMAGDESDEGVALARLACEVGESAPQAPACRSVLALLERYERFAGEARRLADAHGGPGRRFPGLHLLVLAAAVARTPAAGLPAMPEPVAVGEREA